MRNVEWLLREAADERLRMSDRNVIDDTRWRATIERIEVGGGLRVFLTDARAHQDITVEPRDNRTDQWMGSQVTIAGRAEIDFLDGARTHATANHAFLFRPSRRVAAYTIKAGTVFHSAGYGLNVERVERLFDGAVPAPLRPLVEPEIRTSRIVSLHGDRHMRAVAKTLFASGLNGALRMLALEGAVIQLLALQAAVASEALAERDAPREFSAREREALHEARARLLADMRNPPTLGELAAAVSLTEKRLNAGFRALFGATVFETLRNERLEHARIVLASEPLSLKEVAFRVGYNHTNNFINAFTARYGVPPRQYAAGASKPRKRR